MSQINGPIPPTMAAAVLPPDRIDIVRIARDDSDCVGVQTFAERTNIVVIRYRSHNGALGGKMDIVAIDRTDANTPMT